MKNIFTLTIIAFSFSLNAQYAKLIDFTGTPDGAYPYGSLYSDGTYLFGMTQQGGICTFTNGCGTIYRVNLDGTGYTKLMDLTTTTGTKPNGSESVLISDGTFLYGMAGYNGANNYGTLFKIKPDGSGFAKLFDFDNTVFGANPQGGLYYDNTFLYGMTMSGGVNGDGVIFKVKPDGSSMTKLLDFSSSATGRAPFGSLISDGTFLYGMCCFGGAGGKGTLFKIKPDGSGFSKLLDFQGSSNGSQPTGSLTYDGTYLYGMTGSGGLGGTACGNPAGCGTVFRIKPDGSAYVKLKDFDTETDPYGSLILDGGILYGTTGGGGITYAGTFFQILPDGSAFTTLINFAGASNGGQPHCAPIKVGNVIYGTTAFGGYAQKGTVFSFSLASAGVNEIKKIDDIQISPNPSAGVFNLRYANNVKVCIYDISGRCIFNKDFMAETIKNIDLTEKSRGIYFAEINSEKGRIMQKIVLE